MINTIILPKSEALSRISNFRKKLEERRTFPNCTIMGIETLDKEVIQHMKNIENLLRYTLTDLVCFYSSVWAEDELPLDKLNIYFPGGTKHWDEFLYSY